MARASKTAGTRFITSLEDTIVATRIDDGTTLIELQRRRKSLRDDEEDSGEYVRDLFASIVAAAHGRPLPTY